MKKILIGFIILIALLQWAVTERFFIFSSENTNQDIEQQVSTSRSE